MRTPTFLNLNEVGLKIGHLSNLLTMIFEELDHSECVPSVLVSTQKVEHRLNHLGIGLRLDGKRHNGLSAHPIILPGLEATTKELEDFIPQVGFEWGCAVAGVSEHSKQSQGVLPGDPLVIVE